MPLRGGATGLYIKSMGEPGEASVTIACAGLDPVTIKLEVQSTREDNYNGEKSKVIFGNVMSDKVYKSAVKSKKKFIKKFGDDSNVDYPIYIPEE